MEIRGGEDRARAEARTLPVYAGHWLTCNVSLMSLAGHGPKYGSRHECLIIASTGQRRRVSMMQLAHPKVAQPKPGAFWPEVCLCWTMPAKVKANNKLIQSALTPGVQSDFCLSYLYWNSETRTQNLTHLTQSVPLVSW